MRKYNRIIQLTVAVFFISLRLTAQTITPDVADTDKWKLINRTAELTNEEGKIAIRFNEAPDEGYMVLKNTEFANGTVEFDVKEKNIVQQSFVGLLFHGVDEKTYEVKLSIIPNCGHVILYCNFPAVWESMKGFISGDGTVK